MYIVILKSSRINGVEEGEVHRLYDLLVDVPNVNNGVEDSCKWLAHLSGSFSVASVWKWGELTRGIILRISNCLWLNAAPPRVQFFGWLTWRGRIKTSVFLERIGLLNNSAITFCHFCRIAEESVNHTLLFCSLVWKI